MFSTVKRIIAWCGDFKGDLFLGFVFSFFSSWMVAAPVAFAGFTIAQIFETLKAGDNISSILWLECLGVITGLTIGRFLFDYLKARYHEKIGYLLIARDRIKIGEALKRVSLGYFQTNDTGAILNAITTGLHALENMGIRMVDGFVGGYLNFICILIFLIVMCPKAAVIAVVGVAVSFIFLCMISVHSSRNTKVLNQENEKLTQAALEYTRGLPVVKSFGMEGASIASFRGAVNSAALKAASVCMIISVVYAGLAGEMELTYVIITAFLSMSIFGSIEPISDSAHVLAVINNALDKLDEISEGSLLDSEGRDIRPERFDIEFKDVDFSYDKKRKILSDVSFRLPQGSTTAIVGPSGSGKTTICNLIARFYDVTAGSISVGGHNLKDYTCDSLLSNISMVFQNVYLFNDTIRANICFGRDNVTEEEMIEAAKKARCHDFIMEMPDGYDTVIGEGGGTLSGGQKQRISIARAILKDAPIIILDESTASIDPENEHLIQGAITELSKGKTVIIIAHRLATIESVDQILVVDNGRIIEKGTHAELVTRGGKYCEFVKIRQKAENWQIA